MTADSDVEQAAPGQVDDGVGYVVRSRDLEFLGLESGCLLDMKARQRPLAMNVAQYERFVDGLKYALQRESVTDADVRLQGSSAHFFSGWHKSMPYSREQVYELLSARFSRPAEEDEVTSSVSKLEEQWPDLGTRPTRRPFDSMHLVGIEEQPSDYDIQISSDQMVRIVKDQARRAHVDPEKIFHSHPHYGFVEKRFTETTFLYVSQWCNRAADHLKRPVSWALFPSEGPAYAADNPRLSSHFKDDEDWVIQMAPAATGRRTAGDET